jgi:hypothetical protein
MQQLFVRAARSKAFVDGSELSGFAFISPQDGSVLPPIAAS